MATTSKPSKKGSKTPKTNYRLNNPIDRPTVLRDEGGSVIGFKYASGKTVVAKATKKINATPKKLRKMAKESRRKNRGK